MASEPPEAALHTSAHLPATGTPPARRAALTKPRRPRPAPFPELPAIDSPLYWVAVYQRALLAMDAMHGLLYPADPRRWPAGAVRHGLHCAVHDLRNEVHTAAQQLQFQGRILMAVPA